MAKRQGKKNERKRRLLFLIFLFLLTLSIGGVATYAWFTSNTSVAVESLDVQVKTANGLQISADATVWGALVTKDKLSSVGGSTTAAYPDAKNQLPDVFDNVSSAGAVSSGLLQMFHGTVTGDKNDGGKLKLSTTGPLAEVHCTGTAGGCDAKYYSAFDIFLKVNDATDVVLTTNSGVTKIDATDRGIQNTVRVAFVKEGYWADPTTAVSTMQAGSTGTAATTFIWEPNYDVHTSNGILNAQQIYGITTTATGGTKLAYKGVNSAIASPGVDITTTNTDTNFTSVTTVGSVTGFSSPMDIFTSSTALGQLQSGVTKIRVYWWVEGQDVDTENNATNSNMRLTLEFAIKGTV